MGKHGLETPSRYLKPMTAAYGSTVAESSRAKDCPTGDCAEYQRDLQRLYSLRDAYQYHLDSLELVYEVKWIRVQLHLSELQQAAYRLAILLCDFSGNETLEKASPEYLKEIFETFEVSSLTEKNNDTVNIV
jgi:hypothetical protein